mmetsp:Transcript_29662/g.78633  ORF Transcript_29662/g.78633 Transcript_29662/m.78633 type:complete len:279 (+) Transcript_29662:251-1087(+)
MRAPTCGTSPELSHEHSSTTRGHGRHAVELVRGEDHSTAATDVMLSERAVCLKCLEVSTLEVRTWGRQEHVHGHDAVHVVVPRIRETRTRRSLHVQLHHAKVEFLATVQPALLQSHILREGRHFLCQKGCFTLEEAGSLQEQNLPGVGLRGPHLRPNLGALSAVLQGEGTPQGGSVKETLHADNPSALCRANVQGTTSEGAQGSLQPAVPRVGCQLDGSLTCEQDARVVVRVCCVGELLVHLLSQIEFGEADHMFLEVGTQECHVRGEAPACTSRLHE